MGVSSRTWGKWERVGAGVRSEVGRKIVGGGGCWKGNLEVIPGAGRGMERSFRDPGEVCLKEGGLFGLQVGDHEAQAGHHAGPD